VGPARRGGPAKPAEAPLTVDHYHRMIHATQVMNPRYDAREQGLLANLERHLRRRIRMLRCRFRRSEFPPILNRQTPPGRSGGAYSR
jgi:hypothetical protein